MTDGQINASPSDIRKLAGALTVYQKEVASASKKVRSALAAANWHDSNKRQFEARLTDTDKKLNAFLSSDVEQMVESLNELARKLDDIRGVRM